MHMSRHDVIVIDRLDEAAQSANNILHMNVVVVVSLCTYVCVCHMSCEI